MERERTFICEICGCETPCDCEGAAPNVCCDCLPVENDDNARELADI